MNFEQISLLIGACAAFASLITPLIRLNALISRLNTLLDQLAARTAHCEERLDRLESRLSRLASEKAALTESVKQAHGRLDRLKRKS